MKLRYVVVAAMLSAAVFADDGSKPDERGPQFGDPMKDAPFVPTPPAVVDRMLEMAKLTPGDRLIDLGSGDGRIVLRAAQRFGARGLGIEHNAELVAAATQTAQRDGLAHLARFERGDLFETDLSGAQVIALYLLPEMNLRLRPKLLALPPDTRIVAHEFGLGDWQPDERAVAAGRNALLWIVPANVEGEWVLKGPRGSPYGEYRMRVAQRYQHFRGTLQRAGEPATPIEAGQLNGSRIIFAFFDGRRLVRFAGRVDAGRFRGTSDDSQVGAWTAVRLERR